MSDAGEFMVSQDSDEYKGSYDCLRAKRGYKGEHREKDTQYTRIDRRIEHDRDSTHVVDNRVTIYGSAHIATLLRGI